VSARVREPTRVVSVPTAAIKPTLGFWSGRDHAGDCAGDITYVRTWAGFASPRLSPTQRCGGE
jgi:hypothetical protein